MDWATVVPTAITGVVGLAGIGGTLLSARMIGKFDAKNLRIGIRAEDARAELADKRRIYAGCVAALTAYSNATVAEILIKPSAQGGLEFQQEVSRTRLAAQIAVFEVDLIAPPEVAIGARDSVKAILRAREARDSVEIAAPIVNLTLAMRRDLGADEYPIATAPTKPGQPA